MKRERILDSLKWLGFNENESAVYLTLLEANTATASVIARLTDLPRSTAYLALESLERKGLVTVRRSGGPQLYAPSGIAYLERQMRDREDQLRDQQFELNLVREFVDELTSTTTNEVLRGSRLQAELSRIRNKTRVYELIGSDSKPGKAYGSNSRIIMAATAKRIERSASIRTVSAQWLPLSGIITVAQDEVICTEWTKGEYSGWISREHGYVAQQRAVHECLWRLLSAQNL